MMNRLLIFFSILSLTNAVGIVNRRVEYFFTVSYAINSSTIVLINNQMPGPLVEAQLNDIVIIHVTNNLPDSERLAIHFHGMLVQQTPQMDGVPFITQMPIESQLTYTYTFRAYPAGTYFYHSHAGLQSVTAFGPFIIHDRRNPWPVPEVSSGPLLFSDLWFQPDRVTQEHHLLASPFIWQGEPTYLLINGQRDFVLTVEPGKQYLLRLIGSTTLSTVVFGIDQHPMTIVEVDGTVITPRENITSIELTSGQRYAVIIQTKANSNGIFLMQLSIRWRTIVIGSNCTGVLQYTTVANTPTNLSSYSIPSLLNEEALRLVSFNTPYEALSNAVQMPKRTADQEIFLYNYQNRTSDGLGIRWYTNNGTLDKLRLTNLTQPLLYDVYNGIVENLPDDVVYTLQQNQLVDVVLQNTVALNGVCESHPFHLHGHQFWVHSRGTGMYNRSVNINPDISAPILLDSTILYATSYAYFTSNRTATNHLKPCGWMKLRFIANNPGLWLLHCHIGSHLFMGMTVLLKEDIEHLLMTFLPQN